MLPRHDFFCVDTKRSEAEDAIPVDLSPGFGRHCSILTDVLGA
jgi:hypothetical protein